MKRFENKVAIVTGGANGYGRNLVERLVSEGAKVVVADIEEDSANELCKSMPESTYAITTDVTKRDQVHGMVQKTIEKYDRIDVLFNNAGIIRYAPFLEITDEDWNIVVDTNLNGNFMVAQEVAREMVRLNIEGAIVNTASVAANIVSLTTSAYSPSKAGIMLLTQLMALEMAPYNIRVNCVAPGTSLTRFTEKTRSNPERCALFLKNIPMNRFGEIAEVTSLMLFLASDEASYITGSMHYVDGGWRIS